MTVATRCPDPQELQQLLLGRLSQEVAESLERHVEQCGRCGRLLSALPADDTLVQAMRTHVRPALAPSDRKAIQALMPRLYDLRPAASRKNDGNTGKHHGEASPMNANLEALGILSPPQAPGEIGRLGPYRVLKLLGQGGMGVVFLAEDPQLQRSVALKAMLPELAKKPVARQRFLREARATAKIEHDHIVTIYQVGEDRGVPFLAMQLLKGMTLDEFLKKKQAKTGTPLPVGQILKLGLEIAKGLAAAHEQGLIHRDIKPANIWLDASAGGRVKILDFGLARAVEGEAHHTTLTQLGTVLGTAAYMAPEQAMCSKVDGRADLFSLGCILYRIAAGRLPWKGADAMETLVAIASETPTPIQELNPNLPPKLARLIMLLLAKSPEQRPASAKKVAEAIQAIEREQPTMQMQVALPLAAPVPSDKLRHDPTEATGMLVRQVGVKVPNLHRRLPRRAVLIGTVALASMAGIGLLIAGIGLPRGATKNDSRTARPKDAPASLPSSFTNTIGMKMVAISPGKFFMGAPPNEPGRNADSSSPEQAVHEVELTKPFFMGAYPVTRGQFRYFVQTASYKPLKGNVYLHVGFDKRPGFQQTDAHPVLMVGWDDAVAFCDWLSKKEGRKYRLPTEAEWEYCCRAGSRSAYCFGDDPGQLREFAWYMDNSGNTTHPVGTRRPNAWGLWDMHGNIWQWTADWYGQNYIGPKQDPTGPATGTSRVLRGGCFHYDAAQCRCSSRKCRGPNYATGHNGFRVVLEGQ